MAAATPLYRLLTRKNRATIREICRQEYLNSPRDADLAIERAKYRVKEMRSVIVSILISVAIRLVIEMIMHWINNGIQRPSPKYQPGEPGA